MQPSRNHQRARSAAGGLPSPSSPRRHAAHRSTSSVPELPVLQLYEEGLGFPGLPTTPTRPPYAHAASRNAPALPPIDFSAHYLEIPRVPRPDSPHPRWDVPVRFEEPREVRRDIRADVHAGLQHTNLPSPAPQEPPVPAGLIGKVMEMLGYAGRDMRARRAALSLVFSLIFWFAQFVVIVTLLAYSSHRESPTVPGMNEWDACDRPLGTWNAIWLIKVAMSALLSVWNWKRERAGIAMREQQRRRENGDAERLQPNAHPQYGSRTAPRPQSGRYESTNGTNGGSDNNQLPPQTRLHSRVSLCSSFLTLAWFLTAHVLEYTSVNSCRFAAPHLWWLTFGILCTLYVLILEIFLLGLLLFVLGPVIFLVYNILLLCLGRHPLQNPHYIKPDIDKLPKSVVDQIPLVLYIPPPPEEEDSANPSGPITVPPAAHSYPPKRPAPSSSVPPKRRFAFFRRKKTGKKLSTPSSSKSASGSGSDGKPESSKEKDLEGGAESDEDEDVPWDEMWEKGEHPFVRLEGNRAVCAICLMDFEEPKRIRGKKANAANVSGEEGAKTGADAGAGEGGPSSLGDSAVQQERTQEVRVEEVTEEERDALHLNDAGEGSQPLRLLACGHVFHQTCVDPWLTDVSGRCPICQRPVEVPQTGKKSKRRQRR
ncbi:hypothetical protein C8Q80DRAFT_1182088 [Daedaleopsis nitida]|nr:hypothetical protein C8Q80DRAFT_1182088 [Daedaleopsis nitida]